MMDHCTLANEYKIKRMDFERPWGGFYHIDNSDIELFCNRFFPDLSGKVKAFDCKILVVDPGQRLSWQYHDRRREIWRVIKGPIGYMRSLTNDESELIIVQDGELITLEAKERHRLIGLSTEGIVAEIWEHIDCNNPSNEEDIVRLQDDYKR